MTIRNTILGFLIFLGLPSCIGDKFVEYRPHHLIDEIKYYRESELDSMEFLNTIHVLDYYGEDFKTKNGNVIFITQELSEDWELVWNYTTKANDNDWLKKYAKK